MNFLHPNFYSKVELQSSVENSTHTFCRDVLHLHARFSNTLIIFKCFVIMHLVRMSLIILLSLKDCQQALKMDGNFDYLIHSVDKEK